MRAPLLKANKIDETIGILAQRIEERFPGAGLAALCRNLHTLAQRADEETRELRQPILPLRFASGLLIALIVAGLAATVYSVGVPEEPITFIEVVQVLEAGINDVVLIGLAIFFLVSLERRLKRRRALRTLHELRSIAHIVDMHQLTKDPGHQVHRYADTPSSPRRALTPPLLARYFDYCSEMLSLTGKVAALYAQNLDDPAVLNSVNEIESMTTGLSRKIWQKLMILETGRGLPASSPGLEPGLV